MIPLFTLAIRRTDEIANALYARGYTPSGRLESGHPRSDYIITKYPFRKIDTLVIVSMVIAFLVVILLRTTGIYFTLAQSPLRLFLLGLWS